MNWGMTMRNALFGLAICTVLIAALPVIYALSPALSLVAVLIVPAFFLYVFDVGSAIAARFSTGTKPCCRRPKIDSLKARVPIQN